MWACIILDADTANGKRGEKRMLERKARAVLKKRENTDKLQSTGTV